MTLFRDSPESQGKIKTPTMATGTVEKEVV